MKNLKQRRNLTAIERERLIQLDDVKSSDIQLLGHILIKYLQFNSDNDLNSKGEFWQNYDDIRNNMMSKTNDKAIREQLKRLVEGDYITYRYKGIEGDDKYRKAIHLSVTDKTINSIMGDDKELKATSNEKYELLQEVRYSNKEKKVFTPEVFKTKIKMKKEKVVEVVTPATTIDEPISYSDMDRAIELKKGRDTIPEVKEALEAFKIANYDISMVYGNNYVKGECKEYDHKREVLDVVYDEYIKNMKILS